MAYTPVLFGLVAACGWGTADYLSRRQSSRVGHYNTVVYSHLVTFAMLAVTIPLLSPSISAPPLPLLVLSAMGMFNFFAFIFLYRAFHEGVVSVVAPIAYTYPVVTAVLSVLLLGVALSVPQAVAISAVMAGVILLSTRFSELRALGAKSIPKKATAGVGLALAASIFFGVIYIGVGYATPLVGFVLPAVVLRGVGSVAGFALAPAFRQKVSPSKAALSATILSMGVLEAVGFLSFTYGITSGSGALPVVAALSGMGGAVAVGYAMYFLRERLEPNQLVGMLLSFVGVFVLLYLGG